MSALTDSSEWQALTRHRDPLARLHLRDLFAADAGRFDRFSLQAGPLFIDYSKHRLTTETLQLLQALAAARGVEPLRDAMWAGEPINQTEDRAVLHVALRNGAGTIRSRGADVMPDVRDVLARMRRFTDGVRDGSIRGHTGEAFTDIVNIGIGGSDLGPCMVTEALRPNPAGGPRAHFVSNVDDAHLGETLARLDARRTLFIVASKTFTTQETMANARAARAWMAQQSGDDRAVAGHFAAVSTNLAATGAFGIAPDRVFGFWDWVGGRYSLWSAIGLPIALANGMDRFEALLAGAHEMDRHFAEAPADRNAPLLLGLIGIWYRNFLGCDTHAVLPYDQRLHRLPAFLQQLDMESNGKRVDRSGAAVDYATGPIVWGEPGTNGQHAFFQLLHQGTTIVPADFIVAAEGDYGIGNQHRLLLANCLAQSRALAFGRTEAEAEAESIAQGLSTAEARRLAPYKTFPGNRPSATIVLDRLTPFSLGALLALYEHKVFVQAAVWNINAFDQWGVELGKQLAGEVFDALEGRAGGTMDDSTAGLLARLRARP